MDIKKDYIKRLLKKFKEARDILIRPDTKRYGRFKKLNIAEGQIIYTTIGNTQGWWSIVCIFDDAERVEIYDMHVFERYQNRYLRKKVYNKEELIQKFFDRNSEGTIYLEPDNKFSKNTQTRRVATKYTRETEYENVDKRKTTTNTNTIKRVQSASFYVPILPEDKEYYDEDDKKTEIK